ncbi:MAG TPA: DUF222 domain-containing protein [Actinocrinis sp.]|nr:DUF222 domain-containing protein [Actinocrinis sp.]
MHVIDHDALAAALANTNPFTPPYDDLDPDALSIAGLMDAVRAAMRATSHIDAFRAKVFAVLEKLIRTEDDGHSRGRGAIESELSATVHLPPATLRTLLAESGALCERFPETLTELSKGNVFWLQVRPLLDLTSCMSDEHARAVQDTVLPKMGDLTPRQNRKRVDSAVCEVDPEGAAERHAERNKQRYLEVRPEADGMATLSMLMKAELAQAVLATINAACAKRAKGDHRTLDQRRVDTAIQMLLSGDGNGMSPAALVHVVINAESLIGLTDTPAHLEGHGPITPDQARALATAPGSELRRLFVSSSGKLLSVEPHKYRVGAALARHIRALYRTCTFPGCGMAAQRCDLDHMHPFGAGGCTCEENLHPACRKHHNEKTAGKWRTKGEGENTVWISTATGRPYVSTPERYAIPRRDKRRD